MDAVIEMRSGRGMLAGPRPAHLGLVLRTICRRACAQDPRGALLRHALGLPFAENQHHPVPITTEVQHVPARRSSLRTTLATPRIAFRQLGERLAHLGHEAPVVDPERDHRVEQGLQPGL